MRTFLVFCVFLPALLYAVWALASKFIDLILPGHADSAPLPLFTMSAPLLSRKYEQAAELYKLGNLEEASNLWKEVLNQYEISTNGLGIVRTGFMVGCCQQRLGEYDDAIRSYTRVTSMPPPEDHDSWLSALRQLGFCQVQVGDYSSASLTFSRLSRLNTEYGNADESVRTLLHFANSLTHKGRTNEASEWFNKAIALSAELGTVAARIRALHDYSILVGLEGRTREAIRFLREAADRSLHLKERPVQAEMYLALAYHLRSVGEIQDAVEISDKAMEIASEPGNVFLLLYAQHSRAIIEWAKGNRDKTFELLDSAEQLRQCEKEKKNEHDERVRVRRVLLLLTRAWYKEEIAQFDDALTLLDKAEPLSTDLPLYLRAELCRSRALSLAKSGRWEQARAVLASGGTFATARSIPYCDAQYELTTGVAAFAAKEHEDSLAALKRAKEFFENAEQKRDTALACKELATVCRALGNSSQAEQYKRRAIDIFAAAGDTKSADEVAML